MKIIVSHIEKQHVNALLTGLWKRGVLEKFFTSIATNKIRTPQYIGEKMCEKLKKRWFSDINSDIITHFPLIALLANRIKSDYWRTFIAYKWFDKCVASALKKADFDIFISYENANLASFQAVKKLGKTTVLDLAAIHHSVQNPMLIKLGTYRNTDELDRICAQKDAALRHTDYILTLSTFAERTLTQTGFPAHRIFKTYLGVNHTVFTAKTTYNLPKKAIYTEGSSSATERCSVETLATEQRSYAQSEQRSDAQSERRSDAQSEQRSDAPFELYFIGLMTNRKGVIFLMNVHKILLERGLNIRLTLIGPIDDFTPPTKETPHYRYISFLNHVKLVEIHHNLDLFVFPSYLDSWGQVVIEAMACGSPTLVSDHTGAKDAVEKGGGYVLQIDDLTAWVSTIERFYNDRFLLEQMGKQAAAIAQTYTWEAYETQVFDAMTAIYAQHQEI
jgi:glycosyltransferase involved in cell wall biosynthesis